jgi:hypothetical protein
LWWVLVSSQHLVSLHARSKAAAAADSFFSNMMIMLLASAAGSWLLLSLSIHPSSIYPSIHPLIPPVQTFFFLYYSSATQAVFFFFSRVHAELPGSMMTSLTALSYYGRGAITLLVCLAAGDRRFVRSVPFHSIRSTDFVGIDIIPCCPPKASRQEEEGQESNPNRSSSLPRRHLRAAAGPLFFLL